MIPARTQRHNGNSAIFFWKWCHNFIRCSKGKIFHYGFSIPASGADRQSGYFSEFVFCQMFVRLSFFIFQECFLYSCCEVKRTFTIRFSAFKSNIMLTDLPAIHFLIHSTTLSTFSSPRMLVNWNGRSPRIFFESRSMTSRLAPTYGARSILLMTSRSDLVIPGPPFLGILSPSATSITKIVASTSSGLKVAEGYLRRSR